MTVEQLLDIVRLTQKHEEKGTLVNLASDLREFVGWSNFLRKGGAKGLTGPSIRWNAIMRPGGSARHTNLYSTDALVTTNYTAPAEIPWRFTETSYVWDVREAALNGGPEQIVDAIQTKKQAEWTGLGELMESTIWTKPASSADEVTPFGLRYYLVSNATEGFNGGDPSGFAAGAAGLPVATYPRWKNYTGSFTNVTADDLVIKMRRAFRKIQFKNPVKFIPEPGEQPRYGIYMPLEILLALEDLAKNQNDQVGDDLASKDGRTKFHGLDLVDVPYLDDDATTPVMFIDWGQMQVIFAQGGEFNESEPAKVSGSHNCVAVFVDVSWNLRCFNRRKQAILVAA